MKKNCLTCTTEFEKPIGYSYKQWDRARYCSKPCQSIGRQGESHANYKPRKDIAIWKTITCPCGKLFKKRESTVKANRGKFCSKNCVYKYAMVRGEQHHNWKEDVGYVALHSWVKRKLGKPMKCEFCNYESSDPRQIHWANKSQEYKRDLSDWLRLCVKCHHEYDDIHTKIWESRRMSNV